MFYTTGPIPSTIGGGWGGVVRAAWAIGIDIVAGIVAIMQYICRYIVQIFLLKKCTTVFRTAIVRIS
jgi:hypothetical protein